MGPLVGRRRLRRGFALELSADFRTIRLISTLKTKHLVGSFGKNARKSCSPLSTATVACGVEAFDLEQLVQRPNPI